MRGERRIVLGCVRSYKAQRRDADLLPICGRSAAYQLPISCLVDPSEICLKFHLCVLVEFRNILEEILTIFAGDFRNPEGYLGRFLRQIVSHRAPIAFSSIRFALLLVWANFGNPVWGGADNASYSNSGSIYSEWVEGCVSPIISLSTWPKKEFCGIARSTKRAFLM